MSKFRYNALITHILVVDIAKQHFQVGIWEDT